MAHNHQAYGDGRTGNGGFSANALRSIFSGSAMPEDMQRQMQDLIQVFAREISRLEERIAQLSRSQPEAGLRPTTGNGHPLISDGLGGYFERDPVHTGQLDIILADGVTEVVVEVVTGVIQSVTEIP